MATCTAYTQFLAYDPVFDGKSFNFLDGEVTSFSPTYVRVQNGSRVQEYFGFGFAADAQGSVTAGTVTQTQCWVDGVRQYTIDGLNHSAVTLSQILQPQSEGGLLYFLFPGNDVFEGSPGNDLFEGWLGLNEIDGGAGLDTVAYMLGIDDYQLRKTAAGLTVTKSIGPAQVDTLTNIERLQFLDWGLALDLGPGEAAANTVRVMGAAFDAPAIGQHRDWVTYGLQLFDSGQSMLQVCEFVARDVLRLNNQAFVDTVFRNVVGAAPADDVRDHFVGLLQGSGGSMTQGQLLELAAGCDENAVNVGLVGLQETGVPFW